MIGFLVASAILANYPIVTPQGRGMSFLCLAFVFRIQWDHFPKKIYHKIALIVAVALIVVVAVEPYHVCFAPGLCLLVLTYCASEQVRSYSHILLLATAFLTMALLIDGTGLLWAETSSLSWGISRWATGLMGETRQLGLVELSAASLLFAGCIWLAQFVLAKRDPLHQVRLFTIFLIGSIGSIALQLPLLAHGLGALLVGLAGWNTHSTRLKIGRIVVGSFMILGSTAGLLVPALGHIEEFEKDPVLGIVDGGMKTVALPDSEDFSENTGAKFGGLTRLFPLYGWGVKVLPEAFRASALDGITVLAIINPTQTLTEGQHEDVEDFVRRGGRLLVLGDHTDIGGIMKPLNDVLTFTSIRFKFDSAIPLDSGWRWARSLRGGSHPLFFGRVNNSFGLSVGASLSCGQSSRVLVMGDRCFSDIGRPDFGESRLGDMTYNVGEARGGLPLVAEQRIGEGVVQVWGDTAGFQDFKVTETGRWIVSNVTDLSLRLPCQWPRAPSATLCLLFLTCGAIILARSPLFLFIGVFLAVAATTITLRAAAPASLPVELSKAAVLDLSHMPTYPQGEPEKSLGRLSETFLRLGTILAGERRFDVIQQQPAYWVIVAPNSPYSEQEARALVRYLEGGGILLLIAGHEHREALRFVLQELELDISPSPYGAAHNNRLAVPEWRDYVLGNATLPPPEPDRAEVYPLMYDAEIRFQESYPIIGKNVTQLVTCWERPIAVKKTYGDGTMILIADSRFANSENLQLDSTPDSKLNVRNVKFLLKCLER